MVLLNTYILLYKYIKYIYTMYNVLTKNITALDMVHTTMHVPITLTNITLTKTCWLVGAFWAPSTMFQFIYLYIFQWESPHPPPPPPNVIPSPGATPQLVSVY